jgi:hypothetical protein
MKKTIFALIAVLLLVLMATCEDYGTQPSTDPDDDLPLFTEDGRPMAHLTIGTGRIDRALTADLAQNNVTFYEVAFKDPGTSGKIYRKSWNYTQRGRIAVPSGNYDDATKAVLFAGRQSDNTLLAVGVISAVDGVAGTTIQPNTSSVTFTLAPLTNDVSAMPITMVTPADPINSSASTFQITGPTTPINYAASAYFDNTNYDKFPRVKMEADQKIYPLFRVPADTAISGTPGEDITATYTIACGTAGANYAGVIISSTCVLISGPATNLAYGYKVNGTVFPNPLTVIPAAGVAVPASGIFDLTIDTSSILSGLSQISIEVPVRAIDITNDFPGTWYIRGGLRQDLLDEGINANVIGSLGGAVLLGIGPIEDTGIDIITTGP